MLASGRGQTASVGPERSPGVSTLTWGLHRVQEAGSEPWLGPRGTGSPTFGGGHREGRKTSRHSCGGRAPRAGPSPMPTLGCQGNQAPARSKERGKGGLPCTGSGRAWWPLWLGGWALPWRPAAQSQQNRGRTLASGHLGGTPGGRAVGRGPPQARRSGGSGRGFLVPRAPRVTVLPAPAPSPAGGFEVLTLVWGQSSRVRGRGGRSGTEEPAAGAEASAGGGTGPGAPGRGHRDVGPSGEVARLSPALTRAWAQRTGSRGAPTPVGAGAAAQPPPRAHRPHTRPHGCPSAVKGRNL